MSKRNYGIELLRLVLMFMVCMLHTLGQGGVLTAFGGTSVEYKILWLMETISYCAVDGFAIISGYVANDKPTRYSRLIELWFQVFFYSCLMTLVFKCIGLAGDFTVIDIGKMLLPVLSKQYWYFTAYFGAFFFFPLIKKYVFDMDEGNARKLLIILFFLFSIMEMIHRVFQLNDGYSLIWIIVLYLIGVLMKKTDLFASKSTFLLISLFVIFNLVSCALYLLTRSRVFKSYTFPTVLLSAMILVVVFSRIQLNGKIISKISPLAFGVFLFHTHEIIWEDLKGAVGKIISSNIVIMLLQVIGIALLIFSLGLIVDFIRKKLFDLLHIRDLSASLEEAFRKMIGKCSEILK